MTSWGALYAKLKQGFPESEYHQGNRVLDVHQKEQKVTPVFENGETWSSDLLVAADGANSTIRGLLYSEITPRYAGYVAWRGLVEESEASTELRDMFTDRFTFFQMRGSHILCYLIPGEGGDVSQGNRRINWVWYWNVAEGHELDALLTDRTGIVRDYSVPPGSIDSERWDAQRKVAREVLPTIFVDLIEETPEPFVQPIFDLEVPSMVTERICLLGDAAFVPRPHTAASTAQAVSNAHALSIALQKDGPVGDLLGNWNQSQMGMGRYLQKMGQSVGNRSQFS